MPQLSRIGASSGSVVNPIRMLLDTRARRINGETKHRMTVEYGTRSPDYPGRLKPICFSARGS